VTETVPANNRIPQAVRQGIPDRRTSYRESPSAISWAGDAVRLEAVGWRIEDVAVMRHLGLVGTIPRGTEALDRAGSWTPWRRVCTRLAQEHPADVARYGGVATSLGRTYVYRWPHGLRRSTLVAICWSSLSARPPGLRCSSQCATRRTNVPVWPQILCQLNAEREEEQDAHMLQRNRATLHIICTNVLTHKTLTQVRQMSCYKCIHFKMFIASISTIINPLIATLKPQKPQSNGTSCNTVIMYTGRWRVGCYIWYSEEGTGWGRSPPGPSSLYKM